eukprot:TRINITY_DN68952_c0_g1_i1.p1 TRINITY_DN68952_c0_g1~~TRINITY_DN68952_c0_g1_i1.p1  ORF type:complete len:357 (-),score=84.01 TRINITY_DN68952_c0_g1_i1:99-1169(-)
MTTSVFVRGFDFGTTEEDVAGHCSQAGTVVSTEMQGKGACVVTFESSAEANQAVEILNRSTIGANTRYVDVKLNDSPAEPKRKRLPIPGKRSAAAATGGGCRVFVRGFDFGTSDEEFEGHMSVAGSIVEVKWVTKGSASVTYSTPEEAQQAVDVLHNTTIEGNSRYIDVILKEDDEDNGGGRPAKKARTTSPAAAGKPIRAMGGMRGGMGGMAGMGGMGGGMGGMGGGMGAWVWVPMSGLGNLVAGKGAGRAMSSPMTGKGGGKGGGKRGGSTGSEDPAGSGRVFVRGFDFGTEDNKVMNYMKKAGPIHTVHWVNKGSAVVVYKTRAAAVKASNTLHGTTIPGNSRFIDVLLKDSE